MSDVELHHGAATDVGVVREANEDAFLLAPPLFLVADGMGGHDRGDVASALVAEEFTGLADHEYDVAGGRDAIADALARAQARIAAFDTAQRAAGAVGFAAGTTVVAALMAQRSDPPRWLVANLGDSRAYRFSRGGLHQISTDHSVVQELVDAGRLSPAAAADHPDRHIITRALGGRGSAEADYFEVELVDAERLLLCSDGVSGMLDDAPIAAILAAEADPRDAADRLVAAAVAAGGHDNATAVVVDVVGLADDRPYDSAASRQSLEQKLGALP